MIYLINYSVKNLTRNKRRTFLTLFAICFAVFFMVLGNSYFSGVVDDLVSSAVRENGHIILQKKSFTKKERMLPLDEAIINPEEIIREMEKIKNVVSVSERINFGAFFVRNGESIASLGTAFDSKKEETSIKLKDCIVKGSYFKGDGKEIIIGSEIAKTLGVVNPGETLTLLTRDINGSFTGGKFHVSAIVDMGTKNANKMFYIPLSNGYKMLKNYDMPQKIIVRLKSMDNIASVKNQILKKRVITENGIDVFSVEEVGIFKSAFSIIRFLIPVIFSFFAIIALFTISNTMMMTVMERTSEIGVLQALGIKRGFVSLSFIFEVLSIGIIGSVAGAFIASVVVYVFSVTGIEIGTVANGMPISLKSVIYPLFSPFLIFEVTLFGIFISFLAGIIPALRALRLNPASAIRG